MLREDDLKELGVERLGERKQIMQQIGALKRGSIVGKTQQVGISIVKLIGGSYVIALLAALVTSLQFHFVFFQNASRREISLDAGLTLAAGLLTSFLLAPIVFQILKRRNGQVHGGLSLSELTQARILAAIIGGIVALIYLHYNANTRYMITTGVFLLPLYVVFQWVLYRAHTLGTNRLLALAVLTGAAGLIIPAVIRLLGGQARNFELGAIAIIVLIGAFGFGLSFYLARLWRLYI